MLLGHDAGGHIPVPAPQRYVGGLLIWQLWRNNWDEKADAVQAVIDKGLNSHTPSGFLSPDALVIESRYFIWVIQKSNDKIINHRNKHNGVDQNLGLHNLVSQPSMRWLATTRKVNMSGHHILTLVDAGFCPFCEYHTGCHWTLNNYIRIHLSLSMFCGVRDCFFATSDTKAMIAHAVWEHSDVYQKAKKLKPKKDSK